MNMQKSAIDAIDIRYLLLESYKKIGLSEDELVVILMIDHLLDQDNSLITADLLSLRMNYPVEKIDKIMVSLLNKNLLKYNVVGKEMKTSIEPLKKRLYRSFELNVLRSNEVENEKSKQDALSKIYNEFEKGFGRTLSPLETSKISEWISYGYSDNLILDALKEALSKNKKTLRSIDKILLEWATREDVKKEGYSARNEKWDKDIEKTIEIAKTRWIDDED